MDIVGRWAANVPVVISKCIECTVSTVNAYSTRSAYMSQLNIENNHCRWSERGKVAVFLCSGRTGIQETSRPIVRPFWHFAVLTETMGAHRDDEGEVDANDEVHHCEHVQG